MAEVKEELSKPQTPNLADLLIAYYNQRNACLLYTSTASLAGNNTLAVSNVVGSNIFNLMVV